MIEKVPTKSLPLTGIDALLSEARNLSQFKDVALLTNKACVTVKGTPTAYALGEILKDNLQCLFSPEHGWSAKGEDGKDVSNEVDSRLNKKVYSLYGALFDENLSRLNDIKTLIIDIQDVGVRCYTFAATCAKVLDYLSTLEKPPAILICDRPNPLGKTVKGPSFNPNRQSLVQYLNVPFQHGQTVGTLITRYNASLIKPLSLKVIPHKDEFYPFKHRWVAPSPALPNWTSVLLYPGLVLLEGVVLSLGRGTDKPFSSLGAPHLDTTKLLKSLGTIQGISATPLTFTPQSSVFQNKTCQGIEFQITNLKNVQSYDLGLQLIRALSKIDPEFQWVQNKEKGSYWIDALLGSSDFRLSL